MTYPRPLPTRYRSPRPHHQGSLPEASKGRDAGSALAGDAVHATASSDALSFGRRATGGAANAGQRGTQNGACRLKVPRATWGGCRREDRRRGGGVPLSYLLKTAVFHCPAPLDCHRRAHALCSAEAMVLAHCNSPGATGETAVHGSIAGRGSPSAQDRATVSSIGQSSTHS